MDDFLEEFFPGVYNAEKSAENNYCLYNNQGLQAFTSSLYLAGMVASFFASTSTRRWGRTRSIMIGGSTFLVGAIMNLAAQNLAMLIVGRLLLGTGIGFVCQVCRVLRPASNSLYLASMLLSQLEIIPRVKSFSLIGKDISEFCKGCITASHCNRIAFP